MIAQRRDKNERPIIDALERVGCAVIQMDKSAGFDLIVVSPRNGVLIFEIKNPAEKWELTPAEEKRQAEVEAANGRYHIVETIDLALTLAGYL